MLAILDEAELAAGVVELHGVQPLGLMRPGDYSSCRTNP
jgi:hypothetical protein